MYSQYQLPRGWRAKMKPEGKSISPTAVAGNMIVRTFDGDTYFVYEYQTREIVAIFHGKANQHGWHPAKAHALSFLNCYHDFNPFELDTIP